MTHCAETGLGLDCGCDKIGYTVRELPKKSMSGRVRHRQRARRRTQLHRANPAADLACAGYRGIDPGRTGLCRHQSAALSEGHSGLLGRATANIDRGGLKASPPSLQASHSSVSSQRATPLAVASGPRSFRLRAGDTSSGRDGQVFHVTATWHFCQNLAIV
jgi:hypothetical protein